MYEIPLSLDFAKARQAFISILTNLEYECRYNEATFELHAINGVPAYISTDAGSRIQLVLDIGKSQPKKVGMKKGKILSKINMTQFKTRLDTALIQAERHVSEAARSQKLAAAARINLTKIIDAIEQDGAALGLPVISGSVYNDTGRIGLEFKIGNGIYGLTLTPELEIDSIHMGRNLTLAGFEQALEFAINVDKAYAHSRKLFSLIETLKIEGTL